MIFQQPDGTTVKASHTARFGEIEQRFYATTPAGRELYDQCLAAAEAARAKNPGLVKQDYAAYQKEYAKCFAAFPKKLSALLEKKLVYGRFTVTPKGLAAKAEKAIRTTDLNELMRLGYVHADGLRYEDFLPVSAAGIFASNLGQYGTKSTATAEAGLHPGNAGKDPGQKDHRFRRYLSRIAGRIHPAGLCATGFAEWHLRRPREPNWSRLPRPATPISPKAKAA